MEKLQEKIEMLTLWAVFPIVGFFVGWLVGMSNTPVVSTLLPLVIGLIGAIGWRSFKNEAVVKDALSKMHDQLTQTLRDELANKLLNSRRSITLGAYWAFGVISFCIACWFGVWHGIEQRLPTYPPLSELVGTTDGLDPDEIFNLEILRWSLAGRGLPTSEAKTLFSEVIMPILPKRDGKIDLEDVQRPEKIQKLVEWITKAQAVKFPRVEISHENTHDAANDLRNKT